MLFYGTVDASVDRVTLDRAALAIAAIEFPGLDPAPTLRALDAHAAELDRRAAGARGADFVIAANEYLFGELGMRGNADDYYNVRNSCLNVVVAERIGIPLTLSLVYMEIARRLDRPVSGIGLPGHFLVQYRDAEYTAFIDTFHGGRVLDETGCFRLARESSGADVPADPAYLQPVPERQIVSRMLNNLRAIYARQKAHMKHASVVRLLLKTAPDAANKPELEAELRASARYLARMN